MAKKVEEIPGPTKKFTARTHVHHGGTFYPKGSVLKLEAKDAKPLLAINAIAPVAAPATDDAAAAPSGE